MWSCTCFLYVYVFFLDGVVTKGRRGEAIFSHTFFLLDISISSINMVEKDGYGATEKIFHYSVRNHPRIKFRNVSHTHVYFLP